MIIGRRIESYQLRIEIVGVNHAREIAYDQLRLLAVRVLNAVGGLVGIGRIVGIKLLNVILLEDRRLLCQVSKKDVARRIHSALAARRVLDVEITVELRRVARKRDYVALTLIIDPMRELRHALGNKVRQRIEVVDVGSHHRMRKFMRQCPIKISRRRIRTLAVDIVRLDRIVIVHVDLQGEGRRLAGLGIILIADERKEILFAVDELNVHGLDGRRARRGETEIVTVGFRNEIEPLLRPPTVERVDHDLLSARELGRDDELKPVGGERCGTAQCLR